MLSTNLISLKTVHLLQYPDFQYKLPSHIFYSSFLIDVDIFSSDVL